MGRAVGYELDGREIYNGGCTRKEEASIYGIRDDCTKEEGVSYIF